MDVVRDECALCVDALVVKLASQPWKNRDQANNLRIDGFFDGGMDRLNCGKACNWRMILEID